MSTRAFDLVHTAGHRAWRLLGWVGLAAAIAAGLFAYAAPNFVVDAAGLLSLCA